MSKCTRCHRCLLPGDVCSEGEFCPAMEPETTRAERHPTPSLTVGLVAAAALLLAVLF